MSAPIIPPIIPDTAAQRQKLQRQAGRCRIMYQRRPPITPWRRGDPVGAEVPKPSKTNRNRSAWDHWPTTEEVWDPLVENEWPPYGVRLNDVWLYLAIKFFRRKQRSVQYPADFDANGYVRPGRVPNGPAIILRAHGLPFYAVYKGYYVLCGSEGAKRHMWLLETQNIGARNDWGPHAIVVGPVLALPHVPGSIRQMVFHDLPSFAAPYEHWAEEENSNGNHDTWVTCRNDLVLRYTNFSYELVPLAVFQPEKHCAMSAAHSSFLEDRVDPVSHEPAALAASPQGQGDHPSSTPAKSSTYSLSSEDDTSGESESESAAEETGDEDAYYEDEEGEEEVVEEAEDEHHEPYEPHGGYAGGGQLTPRPDASTGSADQLAMIASMVTERLRYQEDEEARCAVVAPDAMYTASHLAPLLVPTPSLRSTARGSWQSLLLSQEPPDGEMEGVQETYATASGPAQTVAVPGQALVPYGTPPQYGIHYCVHADIAPQAPVFPREPLLQPLFMTRQPQYYPGEPTRFGG